MNKQEYHRTYNAAYYLRNKNALIAASRANYKAKKDSEKFKLLTRERGIKYYRENKVRVILRIINANHRRRSIYKVGSVSRGQWEEIKRAHGYRCAYCKNKRKLTMDHKVPISRGGQHSVVNIAPACGSCNSSKRDKTVREFLNEQRN